MIMSTTSCYSELGCPVEMVEQHQGESLTWTSVRFLGRGPSSGLTLMVLPVPVPLHGQTLWRWEWGGWGGGWGVAEVVSSCLIDRVKVKVKLMVNSHLGDTEQFSNAVVLLLWTVLADGGYQTQGFKNVPLITPMIHDIGIWRHYLKEEVFLRISLFRLYFFLSLSSVWHMACRPTLCCML